MSHAFWETNLCGLTYSFEPYRPQFYHAVETTDHWIWIALESGRFWFRIGRGKNAVEGQCGAGDWVLCPPREPLYRRMIETSAFHYARFDCKGEGLQVLRGLSTLRNTERLRANFAALKATLHEPPDPQWTSHLLLDMYRHAYRERQIEVRPQTLDAAMQNARDWLETHHSEKVSLEALAAELRLTPSAFSRRFRAAIGVSPLEFLMEKRFDTARQLLLETNLTIDTLATRSGFSSGFYFSRLWTKRFGIAPARFRRAHRI